MTTEAVDAIVSNITGSGMLSLLVMISNLINKYIDHRTEKLLEE